MATKQMTAPMATQRPKVTVILTDEIRNKLETLAAKEMRSLSQMAFVILVEGLESRASTNIKEKSK